MDSHIVAETVAIHVFEVVARAEGLSTIQSLNSCFRDALRQLGFHLFAYLHVIERDEGREVEALFGEGFSAWTNHYRRMRFGKDDPIIREAEQVSEPFYWTEVVRKRPLSLRALRVIEAARQFHLHDGFVAPIRSCEGSISFILFAGNGVNSADAYARVGAGLLASSYGRLGHRLYRLSEGKGRTGLLSSRQRECLKWARAGKSSRDIGGILGISATVVDEHIGKACERLNVRTRVQAILEAGRRGVEL